MAAVLAIVFQALGLIHGSPAPDVLPGGPAPSDGVYGSLIL
jgi:hypothetical protein